MVIKTGKLCIVQIFSLTHRWRLAIEEVVINFTKIYPIVPYYRPNLT